MGPRHDPGQTDGAIAIKSKTGAEVYLRSKYILYINSYTVL
jgi:hypothetical protein